MKHAFPKADAQFLKVYCFFCLLCPPLVITALPMYAVGANTNLKKGKQLENGYSYKTIYFMRF